MWPDRGSNPRPPEYKSDGASDRPSGPGFEYIQYCWQSIRVHVSSSINHSCSWTDSMSLVTRKLVFEVSDLVRHKPACTATEASKRLESSDKTTRGIILSRQRTTKVLIRLRGCAGWSAPLLFAYVLNRFSHDVTPIKTNLVYSYLVWFSCFYWIPFSEPVVNCGHWKCICVFSVRSLHDV